MKANELKCTDLRIGNWIKANGALSVIIGKVIEINLVHVVIENNDGYTSLPLSILEPIEFTEEVLVKIGFEKHDEAMNIYAFENERAIVVYIPNRKLLKIEGVENDVLIDRNIRLNNVAHLHQLQNAYYCLTGEELNIEL